MSHLLPLPLGYFSNKKFSEEQKNKFLDLSSKYVKDVFQCVQQSSSNNYWVPSMEKNGVYYFKGESENSKYIRCVTTIDACVEEIMDKVISFESKSFRKCSRLMFDSFLDGQCVADLVDRVPSRPYFSVQLNWMAVQTPMLMRNRDYCFIEHTNMYHEEDGSIIGYKIMESIGAKICPVMEDSHHLVRSEIHRTGYIFRSKGKGHPTKVVHMNRVDPVWPRSTISNFLSQGVLRLRLHFQRQLLDTTSIVSRADYTPFYKIAHCEICSQVFTKIKVRKYHCHACGHVMCKTCVSSHEVDIPGIGIQKMKLCSRCIVSREQRQSRHRTSHASTNTNELHTPRSYRTDTTSSNESNGVSNSSFKSKSELASTQRANTTSELISKHHNTVSKHQFTNQSEDELQEKMNQLLTDTLGQKVAMSNQKPHALHECTFSQDNDATPSKHSNDVNPKIQLLSNDFEESLATKSTSKVDFSRINHLSKAPEYNI